MNELDVLKEIIENYIIIANKNENMNYDYISIIALLYLWKNQYPEYIDYINSIIYSFEKKGYLKKYNDCKNNIAKNTFINITENPKYVHDTLLYNFVDGCKSRYESYLVMFGLNGRPTTSIQLFNAFIIFSYNFNQFANIGIYYGHKYLKKGICKYIIKKDIRPYLKVRRLHLYKIYYYLSENYKNKKDYINALKYIKLAKIYNFKDKSLTIKINNLKNMIKQN